MTWILTPTDDGGNGGGGGGGGGTTPGFTVTSTQLALLGGGLALGLGTMLLLRR